MSRSKKKNPVISNTYMNHKSLKGDKRRANKTLRKQTKSIMKSLQLGDLDADEYVDLDVQDVSERQCFIDDGKQWIMSDSNCYEQQLRK